MPSRRPSNNREFAKTVKNNLDKVAFENKYNIAENTVFEILASEALEQINTENVIFLDVRNLDEYPKIAFENTLQIPLDKLEKEWHQLDFNATIFVFCQSGIRSKIAVEILRNKNFKNAKSIIGGAKALDNLVLI